MKSFIAALCFGAVTALETIELRYMNYLARFGKALESKEEFETRLAYYIETDKKIAEINN